MSFKPGDKVVYPHHGAAVIEKKEKREAFGEKRDYLVLRMAHGNMTLSVPVDMAEEVGMRWPIAKADVEDLFEVLRKRDVREPANWSRRSSGTSPSEKPPRACPPARRPSTPRPTTSWCPNWPSPSTSPRKRRPRR